MSDPSDRDPDLVLRLDWNLSFLQVLNAEEIRPAEVERPMPVRIPVGALDRLVLEFWVPGKGMVRHRLVPVEGPEQRGPAVWGQM
ncbi:hypothetical protein AB0D63_43245 [Kitasatospora sp. NPDC048343]|uniref:hypothetical protein n=1 Tax=Kitasatospora sp. NPDC048343 TaxID=3154717 RepID=UPI0033E68A93